MIPVQLEYGAPQGCPTQTEFVAAVASRGGDFANPSPSAKTRAVLVTLRREGGGHAGALQLRSDEGTTDPRQVQAASCAEVAEALAVVAAIALRGSEETTPPTPPQSESTASSEATPSPPAPPSTEHAATPQPPIKRDTHLHNAGLWGDEQLSVTAGKLEVRRNFAATLSGGVMIGVVPGLELPRYDLTLERASYITTPEQTSYIIGNVFSVRWSFLGSATQRNGTYSSELNGFRAGVLGCSSLSYDTRSLVMLLCSGFSVGLMNIETRDSASTYRDSHNTGFGAASLELDARYNIGKYFHLGLTVAGEVWLGELRAQREDGSELFHSKLFNGSALLGVGVHF